MYYMYLYSDDSYQRSAAQYGYWSGKSYVFQGADFPVCDTNYNYLEKKRYKNLKNAIKGGNIAQEKYGYVTGFDIEDDSGNIVYESRNDSK